MILDIVIHNNERFLAADEALRRANPPVEKCELGFRTWVGKIAPDLGKAVMNLADSTCIGTMTPVRQFSHLYGFVRELGDEAPFATWDEDHSLKNCVALSRLIHPTSTGYRYAARVRTDGDGKPTQLCRAEISGINIDAHVSPSHPRDWLSQDDGRELSLLIPVWRFIVLPARVSNALWYHEYVFRTWFADVRWTLVCAALEALLNTDEFGNKRQFVARSGALATELGLEFSNADAITAWGVRSKLAHGEAFLHSLPQGELRIYDQMEAILRGCIARSIRDAGFAAIFTDAASVRARWPV